jgi:hypothetical protein
LPERDMPQSPNPIRVPISINLLGNDYTGRMYVGSQRKEVNLLLDTGSSTLAVQHRHYDPAQDAHAKPTHLVQEVAYVDGSKWIGSVVHTHMATARLATPSICAAYRWPWLITRRPACSENRRASSGWLIDS